MWIVKGNEIVNLTKFKSVNVYNKTLALIDVVEEEDYCFHFESQKEAQDAYKYILEGLRRKDNLIYI